MELTIQKYKQTEVGLIPEDWKVNTLGKVAFVTKLAGFEYSLHFNSYRDEGDIIVVRGTNITHNKMDLRDIKTIPTSTSNKLLRSKLFKNDLVFAYVGTIGPIFLIEENDRYHLGPNTAKISVEKEINSKYLYHYFTSSFIANEIFETTSIGAQPSLSMTKIRSFKIITPSLKEQKAIANALSDVDELISNLDQLITKKKAIKQGAMQQLLTPPHKGGKRLEGFTGEWLETILGDVCEIRKGQLITESTRINGPIPVIAGGKKAAYYHANANRFGKTITISGSGANAGYVAFHNYPIFASDCSTIEESKNYSIEYIYFLLSLMQKQIYNAQTGGAQPHIHPSDLNPMEVDIPKIEEQIAISRILYDMEKEIKQLVTKKAKYQAIKQGMMQELLTGKTRLV